MANVSNLVHEMMHHTGIDTRRVVALVNTDSKTGSETISYGIKSGLRPIDMRGHDYMNNRNATGIFLEEACAEEAASRWRESVEPVRGRRDVRHKLVQWGKPDLPWRYLMTQYSLGTESTNADIGMYVNSGSAYCAEAIRQISEYTGVDIFNLMLKSRHPETELSAKRQMVQTIEGVERGLYQKLRNLGYSQKEFIEGYDIVRAAIRRNMIRRDMRE